MSRCSPLPTTHPLCLQNHTLDIMVFSSCSLCVSLVYITPADWHHITVSLSLCIPSEFVSRRDIRPLSLSWPRISMQAVFAHRHRLLATCVLVKHGLGWGMAFIHGTGGSSTDVWLTESSRKAHICPTVHAVLLAARYFDLFHLVIRLRCPQ